MLHRIADAIKTSLTGNLTFGDVIEGLARVVKQNIGDVEKTFPLYYKTPTTCNTDKLKSLVPDDTKESIIYFEPVSQPTVIANHKAYNEFEAILRLVC